MTVLGIETATTVCAAAVARNGVLLREASLREEGVHEERLLGQVDEVLRESGITLQTLDAVAVSIGPGSFTGLRIGLSVAKGFAYAVSMPIVGVPTLEALARHASAVDMPGPGTHLLAALDARRDEVYCQLFAPGGGEPLSEPAAMSVDEARELIAGKNTLVAGEGAEKILGTDRPMLPLARQSSPAASRCSASTVALIGGEILARDGPQDAATLEPRYLKEFFLKSR